MSAFRANRCLLSKSDLLLDNPGPPRRLHAAIRSGRPDIWIDGWKLIMSELPEDVAVQQVYVVSAEPSLQRSTALEGMMSGVVDGNTLDVRRNFQACKYFGRAGQRFYTRRFQHATLPTKQLLFGNPPGSFRVLDLIALVRPPPERWSEEPPTKPARRILVIHGLQDPGNVGTLIRTATALGWNEIWAIGATLGLKTVRASAGAVFKTRIVPSELWATLEYLKKHNVLTLVADMPKNPKETDPNVLLEGVRQKEIDASQSVALWLSSEGQGVAESIPDEWPRIGIKMRNSTESLNVAQAGAILMHSLADKSSS